MENGAYRRKASVLVQDKYGRPAADGTLVTLRVIDSILVEGEVTSAGGDSITGTSMVLHNAVQGGTPIPDFTTVAVNRPGLSGGQIRSIEQGDMVLLYDNVFYRDVLRTLAGAPQLANTLTVSSAFERNYPDYDDVNYIVGASMLSAAIVGEDENGNLTPGEVRVTGGAGVATVWVRYAADIEHIMAGCFPDVDDRIEPVGSGKVYVVATAGDVTAYKQFCFSPVAGFEVAPAFDALSVNAGGDAYTRICVKDGGTGVRVPFYPISFAQTEGKASAVVSLSTPYTGGDGCFTAQFDNVQGNADDTGTWRFVIGDGSADVTVTVK